MAIKLNETNGGKVLEVQVTGKLAHEDYQSFIPEFERLLKQHGRFGFCSRWSTFTAGKGLLCGTTSSST